MILGTAVLVLTGAALVLSAAASAAGLAWKGLYAEGSPSYRAQARGQDLVTLFFAVPAAAVSLVLAIKGSVHGALAVTGLLGYFLYTYASYAFGVRLNRLFLVYVAAFSCALFGFILAAGRLLEALPPVLLVSPVAVRSGAVLLAVVAAAVLLMWLAQIVPAMRGKRVRVVEESGGKPVVQVLDLGVVLPAAVITAVLVLRGAPAGPIWLIVLLIKFLTLGLAVVGMTFFMARTGTPDIGGAVFFSLISILFAAATVWVFVTLRCAAASSPVG